MNNTNPFDEIINKLVKDKRSVKELVSNILEESVNDYLKRGNLEINFSKQPTIETYKGVEFGHLSSSISFELAKLIGISPLEIAENLKNLIYESSNSLIFEKVTNIGGFLNFYLRKEFIVSLLQEKLRFDFLGQSKILEGKKVLVEHTDANPFKEPHIGHLMNNIIGESIFRLIQSQLATTYNLCYQGDVGIHIAKCIYGILIKIDEKEYSLDEFLLSNQDQCIEILNKSYQFASELYETPEHQKNIQLLNLVVFKISQEIPKTKGMKIVNEYDIPQQYKSIYDKIKQIYEKGRTESLNHFKFIINNFGTFFDEQLFESVTCEIGTEIVHNSSIFEKSEGATIWDGKKYGHNVQVIINQYGIPIYACKDIGLTALKIEKYDPDTIIIVTAEEQKFYFRDMFEIFRQLGLSKNFKHISHGQLNLAGGKKMSSRKGTIITIRELLEEVENEILLKFNSTKSQRSLESKAQTIAISAIKYLILKTNPGTNVTFDYEKSLQLTGNTGPYLLYTFARCQSILSKAGAFELELLPDSINDSEMEILIHTLFFEETVTKSALEYNPAVLANYLNQLAQVYNKFYNDNSILNTSSDQEQNFRLFLTLITSKIIKRGCYLLGFETINEL